MKKIFSALIPLIFFLCSCTEEKKAKENEVKDLRRRFSGFVKAVSKMNIDSIQDYTYPKLFTILPRSQSRQSMEKSYAFIKEKAELDSVLIDSLYPVSHIDKGSYSIAICSMVIRMPLDSLENNTNKPSSNTTGINHLIGESYAAPQSTLLATLMRSGNEYGVEVIGYSEINGIRTMRMKVMAIAAKDEYAKDWSFFTVTSDQELLNKLFSKKVLEKLASYNKK